MRPHNSNNTPIRRAVSSAAKAKPQIILDVLSSILATLQMPMPGCGTAGAVQKPLRRELCGASVRCFRHGGLLRV